MLDICIDVSDAQPRIDWHAVASDGIKVAFIKAMEGSATGYPTWKPQSQGAKTAGIFVIPYIFLRPSNADAVVANFVAQTGLVEGQPFAIDWEGRASQTASAAIAAQIGVALQKKIGRTPVGYWGMPGSTPAQPTKIMQAWCRWIPRYPQVPQPPNIAAMHSSNLAKRPATSLFWQYTSAGHVKGIAGDVDRSAWCGTAAELDAWLKTGAMPAHF